MNQAYGTNLSGSTFDVKEYIKSPSVIVRLISLIFSIIVFGCIGNGGYFQGICLYGGDPNACNYGIAVGVIAFLACILFLISDALFLQISNVDHRKYCVILDMGFSGFWAFMWFVGFCYLTNRLTTPIYQIVAHNDVRGAVAFCFFSIISWGGQCYLAVKKYQSGVGDLFTSSDDVLDQQPYSGSTLPEQASGRGSNMYNDEQMIGGDLSGGYQQQHY